MSTLSRKISSRCIGLLLLFSFSFAALRRGISCWFGLAMMNILAPLSVENCKNTKHGSIKLAREVTEALKNSYKENIYNRATIFLGDN